MDKMNELEWLVLLPNFNSYHYNIFNSNRFRECLMDLKARYKKDPTLDLKIELMQILRYCFWGKAEYEIYITPFLGNTADTTTTFKIDVYVQVHQHINSFYDYIVQNWNKIPAKTYRQQANEKKKRLNGPGPKYQCAKCKDIIQSKSVHDFVWCKCKAIAIDGGGYYTKLTGNIEDLIYIGDK